MNNTLDHAFREIEKLLEEKDQERLELLARFDKLRDAYNTLTDTVISTAEEDRLLNFIQTTYAAGFSGIDTIKEKLEVRAHAREEANRSRD
jgi:hypothetical protein